MQILTMLQLIFGKKTARIIFTPLTIEEVKEYNLKLSKLHCFWRAQI